MKKTVWMGIGIIVLVVGAFLFMKSGSTGAGNGAAIAPSGGEVQKITLSVKDYNYFPNTIQVKANQPVELTLDSSVTGCLRAFVIKDLGVSQSSRSPAQTINFTPTKKGSFRFACTMGMGYGTIEVV